MQKRPVLRWLLGVTLLLMACSSLFLEKQTKEVPPPLRTPEARALRINAMIFAERRKRLRSEALYLELREEGRLLTQ